MDADNARQDQDKPAEAKLVEEYRKVGPKAINAALQCKPKKKDEPKRSYQPREEV